MTNPPETDKPITESASEPAPDNGSTGLQIIGQSPLLPPREPLGARVAGVFGRHQAALVALCVLLLWAIVALPPLWRQEPYQVGMAPGHDILVPQQTFLLDDEETRLRQDDAANLVTPDYDPNPNAQAAALADLGSFVRAGRELAAQSPRATMPQWRARYEALAVRREHLSDAMLARMSQLSMGRWNAVEAAMRQAIRTVYKKGQLRSDVLSSGSADLAQARTQIQEVTTSATKSGTLKHSEAVIIAALVTAAVAKHPNQVVNEQQTELLRQVARAGVPPVYVKYKADDVLVGANEIITERHWAQMQEMGLVARSLTPQVMFARLALVGLLVFFGAAYLKSCHSRLIAQPAALWLAAMVPVAFAFAFRLLLRVPHAEYLMVPLAATAAMLLTVLTNARVGVVVGFMLSALCSIMARTDATWLLAGSLASSIGALCVANLSSLLHVVRAGVILALTNVILFCAIGVLGDMAWPEIGRIVLWEAIAGVGAVAFMSGLALLLERPFGITTHFRLMELLSPSETVMKRMQAEAPGTYTHSLMVALLAEAGAKAVGADPLLCHVGGLYHDIGKLRRPHCFIENQSGHNIHDELSPQLSALIILAHVKDGLELGRAVRLPQPVLDIIAQHHGTTVLSYFYNRALLGAQSATIPAADVDTQGSEISSLANYPEGAFSSSLPVPDATLFRYAGPRPQGKEAALVLLADTIEASSRSLPEVTPETLRAHIHKMITLRLQEGELSECELTMRDLGTIETTFTHVLRGVLHQRILYPGQAREPLQQNDDWMQEKWGRRREDREPSSTRRRDEVVTTADNASATGKSSKSSRRRERKKEKRLARQAQEQAQETEAAHRETYQAQETYQPSETNSPHNHLYEPRTNTSTKTNAATQSEDKRANAKKPSIEASPGASESAAGLQLESQRNQSVEASAKQSEHASIYNGDATAIAASAGAINGAIDGPASRATDNQPILAPGDHGSAEPRTTVAGTYKERTR